MIYRNYIELGKIVLVGWVDKTLDQALSKIYIILGLKSTWIWPLDLKAMDEITKPSNLYTVVN
jgi:hypothetical protein